MCTSLIDFSVFERDLIVSHCISYTRKHFVANVLQVLHKRTYNVKNNVYIICERSILYDVSLDS